MRSRDISSIVGLYSQCTVWPPAGKADPGTEVIRGILGATPEATASTPAIGAASEGEGTSWILIASVALGMFVLGAGCSYLLVQRRP